MQSHRTDLSTVAEVSDAICATFTTTEILQLILQHVPTRDLVRARRVWKRFNEVIMADKSQELKIGLFIVSSTQVPREYIVWRQDMRLCSPWTPCLGNAREARSDTRSRPIHELNPALAQLEVAPKSDGHTGTLYGFQDAIVHFNANGLLETIKDDSPWEKMLLTQPGCSIVSLEFFVDMRGYFKHVQDTRPKRSSCDRDVPRKGQRFHVQATGPGSSVTLRDVKRVIRDMAERDFGRWVDLSVVYMNIDGIMVEQSNCVINARAKERGEAPQPFLQLK